MTSADHGTQKIVPNLWFDDQAEDAAAFYTSLFRDSSVGPTTRYDEAGHEIHGRPAGSVMTVDFELADYRLTALNGGSQFDFTPAISFFVVCESAEEIDRLWRELSEGGAALMPLGAYGWSDRYGWVRDRYGLTWQLALGDLGDVGQKITPSLLFVGEQHGRAEEAVRFYTSVFDESDVTGIARYGPDEAEPEGTVKHAQFRLSGETFMAMDSAMDHAFGFNEAVSFLIPCGTQDEVNHYWDALGRDGDPDARQCGWLKDRFGVSWQVCPAVLQEMIMDPDPDRVARVTRAFLHMKKLDIGELEAAYRG